MSTGIGFQYHTELIDGQEIEKPLPKEQHSKVQERLQELFFQLPELTQYRKAPEQNVLCNIDHRDRIVPDITVVRKKAQYREGDLVEAPVLAVEILSPGQSFDDLLDKCERLHISGTFMCWIILPAKRQAWMYSSDGLLRRSTSLYFNIPDKVIRLSADDIFSALDD